MQRFYLYLQLYTGHYRYTPYKIDQLLCLDSFTVKNFTHHWSYFIHFLSKLFSYELSWDIYKMFDSILQNPLRAMISGQEGVYLLWWVYTQQ